MQKGQHMMKHGVICCNVGQIAIAAMSQSCKKNKMTVIEMLSKSTNSEHAY